ncbi:MULTISPECIES: DUF5105 domain-containing protein [Clostridium]|uniref:DUF5105 domain-containing protein n=1 Tax=Clostridium TaxID=1485 RepID=UPI000826A3B9|nr:MULTISPECIES: DUF5105 domain-containing protein [Clostridium]PJI07248.1 DUF5105 domain-containing protein [Clostridium sp. CT7]
MKKIISILMILVLTPAILVGCKPKIKADESAKILSNFIVKNDTSEISKLGDTKSSLYTSTNTQKNKFKKEFKDEIKKSIGIGVDDTTADELYNSYYKALKRVNITTSIVSENDETAEVKVKTNYIDVKQIILNSISDTMDENLDNENDFSDKDAICKKYINSIIDQLNKAKPSRKSKENTFKFVVKDHVWVPQDEHKYVDGVIDLAQGGLAADLSKLKMAPDKSAEMWFNFFVKSDDSGSSKILMNFTGKDFTDKLDKMKEKAFSKGIKSSASDITISDDDCSKIYSAYKNAIKNINVTTETTSKTDDTALVNVKTNYIDVESISQKAASEAISDVQAMNLTDENQAKNEAIKSFINHLENDLNTAKPGAETKEQSFNFDSSNGIWVPENGYDFGNQSETMISGQ